MAVVSRDGEPVATATVDVEVWPSQEFLETLPVGQTVPMLALPVGRTDADGLYDISLHPGSLAGRYVGRNGQVDLGVTADFAGRSVVWHTSVIANGAAKPLAWRTLKASPESSTPAILSVDLGSRAGAALSTDAPKTWAAVAGRPAPAVSSAGLERTTAATSAGLTVQPQVPATCVTLKQNVLYTNVDEIFMAAYGWSGAHATVTQGATSTHTLGVAVKVGTGGWAASGSAGFSESQGSSASQSGIADAYVHNALNYRQYQTVCTGQLVRYTLRAESTYDYLSNFTFAPHVSYATCVTKSAGAVVVKNTATDLTFGAGISLPVGLSVSAQSGWNATTQATWKTTATTKLCGNSTTGWVNSSNISLSAG